MKAEAKCGASISYKTLNPNAPAPLTRTVHTMPIIGLSLKLERYCNVHIFLEVGMSRVLSVFLLVFCLVLSGAVGTASAVTGTLSPNGDEETYVNDVIIPAKNAGTATAEQLEFLERYHLALFEAEMNAPRRDDGDGPDDGGYSWADQDEAMVDFEWIAEDDLEGVQRLQAGDDWNSGPLAFEWVFEWYGEEYNSVNANSNGWLSLNPNDRQNTISLPQCPNANAPNPALCFNNYDLNPAAGGYMWFWTNEEDMAIVGLQEVADYGNANVRTTCQIIFTADGSVKYQYLALDHNGSRANIGWESPDGQDGMNISYRQAFLEDEMAIRISNTWIEFEEAGISLSTDAIDFGNVFIGEVAAEEVEVTNVGAEVLVIEGIETEGAGFGVEFGDAVEIASGESWVFEVGFAPEEGGEAAGTLIITSNAVNAEEGISEIQLDGVALEGLNYAVEPVEAFSELFTGETEEHVITITNNGDAALAWEVEIEITGEEIQDEEVGPQRDPVDATFAVLQDQQAWGWLHQFLVDVVEGAEFEHFNNVGAIGDVDLGDFDAVIVAWNNQSQGWQNALIENLEWFEEYVNDGGKLYIESGGNNGNPWLAPIPGEIAGQWAPESNGVVAVGPDDNLLCELAEWDVDDVLRGSSFIHHTYPQGEWEEALDDGRIDEYQYIVMGERNANNPAVTTYRMGRGGVLAYSGPVGHQYRNWNRDNNWGANQDAILNYILELGDSWIYAEPAEGLLEGGGAEDEFTIFLNAEGLYGGLYTADVNVNAWDPEDGEVSTTTVDLVMDITGAPDLAVTWPEEIGFPDLVDWNEAHVDVFNDGSYDVTLFVENVGTDELIAEGIEIFGGDDYYSVEVEDFVLDPEEVLELIVTLEPLETGNHEAVLTIISNDPDQEEYDIILVGESGAPPIIDVDPLEIEVDLLTGATQDEVITLSNDGEAPLRFWTAFIEPEEEEEERDRNVRSARRVGPINHDMLDIVSTQSGPDADAASVVDRGYAGGNTFVAPRRDEPEDLVILIMKGAGDNGYGWFDRNSWMVVFDDQAEEIERINIDDIEDFNLADYDLVCTGEDQSAGFFQALNANRELLEEYVDGGGNLALFTGSNSFQDVTIPGGDDGVRVQRGPHGDWGDVNEIFLNDDGDGLIEGIEEDYAILTPFEFYQDGGNADRNRVRMRGNSLNYAIIAQDDIPEDGVWYYRPEQQENNAIVAEWPYGRGNVLFTGITGTLFFEANWHWSSMMECVNLTRWADGAGGARWISWLPEEGSIEGDAAEEVVVTFDANGVPEGQYLGDLVFYSNDPDDGEEGVAVAIILNVEGVNDIEVTWNENFVNEDGQLDWNLAHLDLFSGGPYDITINVANAAVEDLDLSVDDIFDDLEGVWTADPTEFVLGAGEDQDVVVTFEVAADAPDDYVGVLTIVSDDPDEEEFDIDLHALASLPPEIVPNPNGIEEELFTGEVVDVVLELANEGEALLRFWIEHEIEGEPDEEAPERGDDGVGPRRDDLGDLLFTFAWQNAPVNRYKAGIARDYDNGWMWITSYSPNWIAAVDPADEWEIQIQFQPQGTNPMGAGWINGALHTVPWANQFLSRWDAEGNALGNLNLPSRPTACTASVENGWIMWIDDGQYNLHAHELDDEGGLGDEVFSLPIRQGPIANHWPRSVLWVDEHPDAHVWVNARANVWNLTPNDDFDGFEVFQEFNPGGNNRQDWDGVGHDGENLYIGTYGEQNYRIFDDAHIEMAWLAYEPTEGEVEGGDAMDIIVTLNAIGLIEGAYDAVLLITSNDPDDELTEVFVTLDVIGASDMYAEGPGAAYNEEDDVYDWNLVYGDQLFNGTSYDLTFMVENIGVLDLNVDEIVTDNENFTVDPEFIEGLAAGESAEVTISYGREDSGVDEATVTFIAEEAVAHPELTLNLLAQSFAPPAIVVTAFDPDMEEVEMIEDDLFTGETANWFVTVGNEGESPLRWEVEIVPIEEEEEEERDRSVRSARNIFDNEGPRRDDPGDILLQIDFEGMRGNWYQGCAFNPADGMLYVFNYSDYNWHVLDPGDDYARVDNFFGAQNVGRIMSATWGEDGVLYANSYAMVGGWAWKCHMYDAEGEILGRLDGGFNTAGVTISRDDELVFIASDQGQRDIHVYEMGDGELGEEVGVIAGLQNMIANEDPNNRYSRAILWVDGHPDGNLWLNTRRNGQGNTLWNFAIDGDWNAELVQSFASHEQGNGQEYDGMTHDGENLIAGSYGNAFLNMIDDGYEEMALVGLYFGDLNDQEDPEEWERAGGGETAGGEETLLTVHLDAADMLGGDYASELHFLSNDPETDDENHPVVDVLVHVTGVPDIHSDVEEGDHPWWDGENVNWNDAFAYGEVDELYSGGPYTLSVLIMNVGTEDLIAEGVEIIGGDGAFTIEVEDFVLGPDEELVIDITLEVEEGNDPDEGHSATLQIVSNDFDEEEYEIPLYGRTQPPPRIVVDPEAIDDVELFTGETEERVLTVSNEGDGEAQLRWSTEFLEDEEEEEERDRSVRSARRIGAERPVFAHLDLVEVSDNRPASNDPVWNEGFVSDAVSENPRHQGPRRDDPPASNYALFAQQAPWGYDLTRIFNAVEDLEWTRYQNFEADFDLGEFDAIWIGNYQPDAWITQYNNHLEEVSDFVASGGAVYHCVGTNYWGVAPEHPGGIVRRAQQYENVGVAVVGPDDNFFMEYMEWDVDQQFTGNSFFHADYPEALFEDNDEIGDYQVMIVSQQGQNPVVANYQFGRGFMVISGTTDGFLHNNPQNYIWGTSGEGMLWYLDHLANYTNWLTWVETEGIIDAGGDDDITVLFDATGLIGGEYSGWLQFFSNDPIEPEDVPDVEVRISMEVTGIPGIDVTPGGPEEDENGELIDPPADWATTDWGVAYIYEGGVEPVLVEVLNSGTEPLVVEGVESDDEAFFVADADQEFVLEVEESRQLAIWFAPEEAGDYEAVLTFITNVPIWEDGYPVRVMATAMFPPIMFVDPEEVGAELPNGENEEQIITVGNDAEEDGADDLIWWTEFITTGQPGEDEEERDRSVRSARSVGPIDNNLSLDATKQGSDETVVGPRRDDFGDLIGEFVWQRAGVNQYKGGIAWDADEEIMWLTNYNMRWIGAVDPSNDFEEVVAWQSNQAGNPFGAGFLNGVLYNVPWANQWLQRWDREGEYLGNFNLPTRPTAATVSHENNWIMYIDAANYQLRAYEIDDEGALGEQVFALPIRQGQLANLWPRSVLWVDAHPDAPVWINTRGNVWNLIPNDDFDGFEVAQNFNPGGNMQDWDGLGHDGENLWVGTWGAGNYRIFDDGYTEMPPWFVWEPMDGGLDPDGNPAIEPGAEQDIIVVLDAGMLQAGLWEGVLKIYSNDPIQPEPAERWDEDGNVTATDADADEENAEFDQPDAEVLVWLEVIGAPVWEQDPLAEDGMDFPNTYTDGGSSTMILTATNIGTDDLIVNGFVDDEDNWSLNINDELVLAPEEEYEFEITFHPVDPEEYVGMVTFETNVDDDNDGVYETELRGTGMVPPVLEVDLEGLDDGEWMVYQDRDPEDEEAWIMDYVMSIANAGGDGADDLNWDLGFFPLEEEEEGARQRGDDLPRRDPVEATFAVMQDQGAWGWLIDVMVGRVEGAEVENFNNANAIGDIDLNDFDAVVIAWNDQSDAWHQACQNNLEWFEDYVSGGGRLYIESGGNRVQAPTIPGSIPGVRGPESNGRVIVGPDENLLVELAEWDVDRILRGSSFMHHYHAEGAMDDAVEEGRIDAYQVIVEGERNGQPAVIVFEMGSGGMLVGCIPVGHQYQNFNRDNNWGANADAILNYLLTIGANVPWIDSDENEGTLEPGADQEVTITIDVTDLERETDYFANMVIESNDVDSPFEVEVHLFTGRGGVPPDWDLSPESDRNHSAIISAVTFEDEEMEGWWVGAFDNRDSNISVSFEQWEGEDVGLVLWGDDPETEDVDEGYEAGQALDFRIWDPFAEEEYLGGEVQVNYVQGPQAWVRDALTIIENVNARGVTVQEVEFRANWNLISIAVIVGEEMYDPDDDDGPDIPLMMAQFRIDEDNHHVFLMKNGSGRFYAPAFNDFNNIPFWNVTEGYQVRMDEAIVGEWTGAPVAPDADIPLRANWNMIAYFPEYDLPMDVVDRRDPDNEMNFYAIRPIIDIFEMMKNVTGQFAVQTENILFSNMDPLTQGQGYQLRVSDAGTLNSPGPAPENVGAAIVTNENAHWTMPINSDNNMSVLITSVSGHVTDVSDQIAAFNTEGELVGAVEFNENGAAGLAVWGDSKSTDDVVEGLAIGEAFELRLWNAEDQTEQALIATIVQGQMTYEADAFTVLDVTVQAAIPDDFYLSQAYPNPFNNVTRMAFGLPEASEISIMVYDVAGRLVQTLVDGQQTAGHHTITWNAADAASGVYLVRMESSSFTSTRKLMLVK